MKRVAIIGAGPAGLVAARHLCRDHCVTIFEQASQIGGLWGPDGLIHPHMQTNLSRYTVTFSDLAWESVDCGLSYTPTYLEAWQVNRYLEEYCRRYIPEGTIRFNTRVTKVERVAGEGNSTQWKIETEKPDSPAEQSFDYLVLANGFSSHPAKPNYELGDGLTFGQKQPVPIIHSTDYRDLSDIFPDPEKPAISQTKRRILVVGGSHSGSDTATTIAFDLSDKQYAPGSTEVHYKPTWEIVHLMSNPMYAIPPMVRADEGKAAAFMPLDFRLYNRSNVPSQPDPKFSFKMADPSKNLQNHQLMNSIIHGKDDVLINGTAEASQAARPYGVVSETYYEYQRPGYIKSEMGTLKSLSRGTLPDKVKATVVTKSGDEYDIDDVDAVVQATGFDATQGLSFLSDQVKEQLGFDESFPRVPLTLDADFITGNSSLPEFACLGFSMGAYWGCMEMQARVIAARWRTNGKQRPMQSSAEVAAYMKNLREAHRAGQHEEIPPIIFGDYIGLMEEVSRELGLERVDLDFPSDQGPISPARYVDPDSGNLDEARKTMQSLQETYHKSKNENMFLSRIVFHALQGRWGSGTRWGEFYPRRPTAPDIDAEFLIEERDSVSRETGEPLDEPSVLRFLYRYSEATDSTTVWFTDKDGVSPGKYYFCFDYSRSNVVSDPDKITARRVVPGPSPESTFTYRLQGTRFQDFVMEMGGKFIHNGQRRPLRVEDTYDSSDQKRFFKPGD